MTRSRPRAPARGFFDRPVTEVARELLGMLLVRTDHEGRTVGRIVEVEAYLAQGDSACHAAKGRQRRNASMFGPPGRAYVYSIHARYCLNVVTEPQGVPSAVLIRAVEPLEGIPLMQARRGRRRLLDLARGPGRLCEAFAIDRHLDGSALNADSPLWIAGDGLHVTADRIASSPRIGVTSAQHLPLRFFVDGSPFVSGPRKFHGRPLTRIVETPLSHPQAGPS
jgi:DNA-3-methyladenine glycosylase